MAAPKVILSVPPRVRLSDPKFKGREGILGDLERGRHWVHLDEPYFHPEYKVSAVSVQIQRKHIEFIDGCKRP